MEFLDPQNLSREELVSWFNSDNIQKRLLESMGRTARYAGLTPSFEGVYRQGFLDNSKTVNLMPFIIAQNPESRNLMHKGMLEGAVIEFMKWSFIFDGQIDSASVKFIKQYRPTPAVKVNPNPIIYEGLADADGVYRGKWKFSSSVGDLAREGTFEMISVL